MGECAADMASGRAMNRLVQGDVGSGKTLVAAALVWYAARNGLPERLHGPDRAALAEQHYATLSGFLAPFGLKAVKLTGSMGARAKREALRRPRLRRGRSWPSAPTRSSAGERGLRAASASSSPTSSTASAWQQRSRPRRRRARAAHVLVMTATPIPRTLALIIYGDLDVSVIDELPPWPPAGGHLRRRQAPTARGWTAFIHRLVPARGRQAFVVCPAIEPGRGGPAQGLVTAE